MAELQTCHVHDAVQFESCTFSYSSPPVVIPIVMLLIVYSCAAEESANGQDFRVRMEQLQEELAQKVFMVHFARYMP